MVIIHDSKFYYDDGNIVLAAKDESENDVYFRLHKSILAKQSPVFADLFILPTPSNMELYDGVPLVKMAGDSASDLREFIELLYDPQRISNILAPRDGRWLSIADDEKLDMMYGIVGDWPDSLSDSTLRLRKLPKPSSSILLARECGATSILPFAFMDLLQCHPELDANYDGFNYIYDKDPERHLLSSEDLHRLLPCQAAIHRTWLRLGKDVGRYGNVMQFSPKDDHDYADTMCPKCKHKLGDEVRKLQKQFVELLDTFFQLNE
ncbi:hypothetical protein R3P38DRAFT_3039555 [Favolaschia claudopus]|uniref:BTB domain-containing protein n=1 Tax=Favolaschia claudopus TaxID=2862362 RepID=A0AAW0AAF9_9AGAR